MLIPHVLSLSLSLCLCCLILCNRFVGSVPTASESSALQILSLVKSHLEELSSSDSSQERKRPYVTIGYAQTIDGSISPLERSRLDISSKDSFRLLHSLRACHDVVLIGINTLEFDIPRLNVRDPLPDLAATKAVQPRAVIIDSGLRIVSLIENDQYKLENGPIVFSCVNKDMEEKRWNKAARIIKGLGGELVWCNEDEAKRCNMRECLETLKTRFGIKRVLVEGGAGILQTVLETELVDQVVVTIRPSFFGGYRSMVRQLRHPRSMDNLSAASVAGDIVLYGRFSLEDKRQVLVDGSVLEEYKQEEVTAINVGHGQEPFARHPVNFLMSQ